MTRRSSNRFSFEGSPFDLPLSAIAGGPLSKNVRPIFLNHAMPPGTRIESTESIGHLGLPGGVAPWPGNESAGFLGVPGGNLSPPKHGAITLFPR